MRWLLVLLLLGLPPLARAASKACPSGTFTPTALTTTGPSPDSVVLHGNPSLLAQTIRTAGTATVALEVSCNGTNWAAVTSGSVSVDGTTTTAAVSVLQPTCTYRANVTACSSCSVTVLYSCGGP